MKKIAYLLLATTVALSVAAQASTTANKTRINVMAPLQVGLFNPADPMGVFRDPDARKFDNDWKWLEGQLEEVKKIGVHAVSTDVWWGATERENNNFDWRYYKKLASAIKEAGLKWVPILSFHQCGGNVGDDCNIPLPAWVWSPLTLKNGRIIAGLDWKNVSSQGNASDESLSVFASEFALPQYSDFMIAFQKEFASSRDIISEINVSLGPAGELRYPSYNSHDERTGYPFRGALQAYSDLAVRNFRDFLKKKYGTLNVLNRAWKTTLTSFEDVRPPDNADLFFGTGAINIAYGKDLYSWYNAGLLAHGERILNLAVKVFDSPLSPFKGIDIGAKMPGVHWRMASDRYAEFNAGLIDPKLDLNSESPSNALGYATTLAMFERISDRQKRRNGSNLILHLTCLEFADNSDPTADSRAQTLVRVIGQVASPRMFVKGENALSDTLADPRSWKRMEYALDNWGYRGLTILRIGDALANSAYFKPFVKKYKVGKGKSEVDEAAPRNP